MADRYRAFISYAHRDERWARKLQAFLERYRVPRQLAGQNVAEKPNRLFPIFRDRDELATSANLSAAIESALERSDALIVICSPAAARSKWVNEEIRRFQMLGRETRIYCFLVQGTPDRTHPQCAFPAALLRDKNEFPLPDPLAADVRPAADGNRGAMLKIAASLLDVGIDDLKQRDAHRQIRQRTLFATASLAVAVVTIVLAVTAMFARQEAEIRRNQAESLIGFMLGDLRDRLTPLGRLDLLDAVGDKALDYFAVLGNRGTSEEILSRVMALRQIGEVRFRQGQFEQAGAVFEESRELARALYRSSLDNPDSLFELGQAEFWVGYAALEQGGLQQAATSMSRYMQYSRQLLELEPGNADYKLELVYAYSNLGSIDLRRANASAALQAFQESVLLNEELVAASPKDSWLRLDLGNGYSWIGAAQLRLGQLGQSEAGYQRAVDILTAIDAETDSPLISEARLQNTYHLGNVVLHRGRLDDAKSLFEQAKNLGDQLVAHDPDNGTWRVDRSIGALHLGEALQLQGSTDAARRMLVGARDDFALLLEKDPNNTRSAQYLAITEGLLGVIDQSLELLAQAHARLSLLVASIDTPDERTVLFSAIVTAAYGQQLTNRAHQVELWTQALGLLQSLAQPAPASIAVERQLHQLLGQPQLAEPLERKLRNSGFIDPRFRGH